MGTKRLRVRHQVQSVVSLQAAIRNQQIKMLIAVQEHLARNLKGLRLSYLVTGPTQHFEVRRKNPVASVNG
jgi:hypothetical protein